MSDDPGGWIDITDRLIDMLDGNATRVAFDPRCAQLADVPRSRGLVIEGQCPHEHGPLERADDCGWCSVCRAGWSVLGRTLRFHHEPGQVGRLWLI